MLRRYGEVLNIPVICADSGKKAGVVKDVMFSPDKKEVKAFLLENTGLSLKKKVVFFEKLSHLGGDAAVIGDSGSVTEMDRQDYAVAFPEEGRLLGLKVFSKTGGEIGSVRDVIFDDISGKVEGFEISDGLFQDVMGGRKMLPLFGRVELGKDFAVVENEAIEEMQGTGGGIKNKLLK